MHLNYINMSSCHVVELKCWTLSKQAYRLSDSWSAQVKYRYTHYTGIPVPAGMGTSNVVQDYGLGRVSEIAIPTQH